MRLLGSDAGGGEAESGRRLGPIRARNPIPQHHGHGTSPMSPREPQRTPPKTLAMQSSRDMLEKLRREIDRLAGSIVRQDIVDNGLNAAMTAWHLTDWVWREIQGSTRRPTLTARAGAPIREFKQFQELVKRNCAELAYCEDLAISTKHFAFSKLPVFSTKVTERFKINPDPIGKDGGATRPCFIDVLIEALPRPLLLQSIDPCTRCQLAGMSRAYSPHLRPHRMNGEDLRSI